MKRELSVPEKHQLKIARDTLRMSDAMVGVMGGMTKAEAREILKRYGDRTLYEIIKVKKNPSITPEAHELYLFTISDGDLYRQQGEPIVKNLANKMVKGIFRRDLAVKLYTDLADNAAKKYTFEHDDPGSARTWHQVKGFGIFTTAHRREAAAHLLDHYMEQIDATARVMRAKLK